MIGKAAIRGIFLLALCLLFSGCQEGQLLATSESSVSAAPAATTPDNGHSRAPALFFTDITSGPNTGGEAGLGAFITLFGEGFGPARGNSTVTIGGAEVANYVLWGQDNGIARDLDMIVVQPGDSAATGDIVVTVNGLASNPLPFTVRSGQIYFVIQSAPNADDTNPGTFAEPFKTIYRPRQVMEAGDIVYIKGGWHTAIDPGNLGWDAILILDEDLAVNGTADRPVAYIGYPGDSPVLANPAAKRGILLYTSGQPRDYYVLANLTFTQSWSPLPVTGKGHRIIGNYLHDGAFDDSGTIGVNGDASQIAILGNRLLNNGTPEEKLHHGIYLGGFGTNQDVEVGWNEIRDQNGGRGIQLFGHVDGDRMENIRIHDNLVAGSELNNITLGGSDGSNEVLGAVYVYNNLILNAGEAGLRVNDPQGTVVIQNNVLYNNGTPGYEEHVQLYFLRAGDHLITFRDNILYAGTGQTYYLVEPGVDPSTFNAANNLVFNGGPCPAWDASCLNADPLFTNVAALDFSLQPQSPAINHGVDSGIIRDYLGISRPQGASYDIGAFEFITGTASLPPAAYLPMVLN